MTSIPKIEDLDWAEGDHWMVARIAIANPENAYLEVTVNVERKIPNRWSIRLMDGLRALDEVIARDDEARQKGLAKMIRKGDRLGDAKS